MPRYYRVELAPAAARQIKKLSRSVQRIILKQLDSLKVTPRPHGAKKLVGTENLYRIRVGDYRIIYCIDDPLLLILIVKVGNRKEIYQRLHELTVSRRKAK